MPKGCKVADPRGRMPWILVYGVRAKNVHYRQEPGRRQGSPERVRPARGGLAGRRGAKTVSRPGWWRGRQRSARGLVQKTPGRAGRENGKLWNARRARRTTCHKGGLLRRIIRVLVNCPAIEGTQGVIWRNGLPIVWCMASHSLRKSGADGDVRLAVARSGMSGHASPGAAQERRQGGGGPHPLLRIVFRR